MYPLLFSSQTQVDVPSTCTTKDAPSNVLRQRSQAVKPLILCEWGYKRILRQLVLWILLYKGKGRIKRILRLCHFEFFDKGEGRHKRIQAVSPWRILFGKGRREWKRWITQVLLSRFGKPENFGKHLAQRRRSSKRFKACKGLYKIDWKSILKRKSKPCFFRLFISGQEDHLEEL